MKGKNVIQYLLLLAAFFSTQAYAQSEGDHLSGDIQLQGLLGDKLKIEMLLKCNHEKAFFSNTGPNCIDVEGDYAYRTQGKPIALKGRLCPANGTFYLTASTDGDETERFEGKWNPAGKQLSGTWTLKKTAKTMPFQLTAVDAGYSVDQLVAFFKFIDEQMTGEPDAEGATIGSAQWLGKNGKVTGFAPNWGGDLTFLSPGRLEYYTSYNSTARSSYYENFYQLLKSTSGTYVLYCYNSSNYDKPYDLENESDEGSSTSGYSLSVYKLVGGNFLEQENAWPADVKSSGDKDDSGYAATVWADGVRLPSGDKLYWDGTKFVK